MMIERRGVATTFEEELQDCVLEQEKKRIPGSTKSSRFPLCCLLLLRADVREQGGCRELLWCDEDRLHKHSLDSRIDQAARRG